MPLMLKGDATTRVAAAAASTTTQRRAAAVAAAPPPATPAPARRGIPAATAARASRTRMGSSSPSSPAASPSRKNHARALSSPRSPGTGRRAAVAAAVPNFRTMSRSAHHHREVTAAAAAAAVKPMSRSAHQVEHKQASNRGSSGGGENPVVASAAILSRVLTRPLGERALADRQKVRERRTSCTCHYLSASMDLYQFEAMICSSAVVVVIFAFAITFGVG